MKIFRGFLIVLCALFMICVGILALIYPFGILETNINTLFKLYTISNQPMYVYIIFGVLFVLFGLIILFGKGIKKKQMPDIIRHTELGELRISNETIKGLALSAVQNNKELKDCELMVSISKEDQIKVNMRAKVNNDSIIPDLTLDTQKIIKETIESCTGISVESVTMEISSLTGSNNDLIMPKKEV